MIVAVVILSRSMHVFLYLILSLRHANDTIVIAVADDQGSIAINEYSVRLAELQLFGR